MKTGFYPRLAWNSIKKNKRLYIPYILTCTGTIMIFYIIHYLAAMPALDHMSGGADTKRMLGFGVWVIAVFALAFLLYTNSFLMRRRKKEFGLYHILGMGKKNLSMVYFWETLIVYVISLFLGFVGGIALSKMAELGLIRMIGGKITYDFTVSGEVIEDTLMIFGIIFVLLLLKGLVSLWRLNAIALLHSENVGEKPPRANYLLGIGGFILLAAAYYIAVSIESPLLALAWFFIAVIMVIIATYVLFISGSVVLCRILQKNKKYYYKENHFISVSSMAYRMKRNGAGLASICILCTMVLVMMLGAASLYFGVEDSLKARYPKDISVMVSFSMEEGNMDNFSSKADYVGDEILQVIQDAGVKPINTEHYLCAGVTGMLDQGEMIVNPETIDGADMSNMNKVYQIYFIPLSDYNTCMGTQYELKEEEVLISCVRCEYNDSVIRMPDGRTLVVKKQVEEVMGNADAAMDILPSVFLIVNDLNTLCDSVNAQFTDTKYYCRPILHYAFDTTQSAEEKINLQETLMQCIRDMDEGKKENFYSYYVECRAAERDEFYGCYGGIFFLGIILSVVFLFATVLIIYYKQITEGYEDENRFAIMQKVGMTKADIRKSVNSQMLTVFFLPLVTAVVHLGFAFPMVQKLLALFNLRNVPLMITVLAVTVFIFGVFYTIIYKITSNAYFSIVSGSKE